MKCSKICVSILGWAVLLLGTFNIPPAYALGGEGVLGWCAAVGPGMSECFASPYAACKRAYDVYGTETNEFRGYKPTEYWWAKACDWQTHIDGGDFSILPADVYFQCEIGSEWYQEAYPGRCVPYYREVEERPLACNSSGSPNPTGDTNPIVLATGAKFETEEDFTTEDKRLQLVRHYRSFRSSAIENDSSDLGNLGINWRYSFGYELTLYGGFGIVPSVTLYMPDGTAYDFQRQLDGSLISSDSDAGQVPVLLAFDGAWPADLDAVTTTPTRWKLTLPDNKVVTLETSLGPNSDRYLIGRPIRISSRDRYTQILSYDSLGALSSITDSFGRKLDFKWIIRSVGSPVTQTPLVVEKVGLPDGSSVRYVYDTAGVGVLTPDQLAQPDRLIYVEYLDPAGQNVGSKSYLYEDLRFPWALTGIQDERRVRIGTWTYDTRGRAISSQTAGGLNRYTVSYTDTDTEAKRTVTNPFGKKSVYQFERNGNILRLQSNTGQPSLNCVGTTRRWEYDPHGYVRQTVDQEGRKTQYSFNVRGLPTQIVEAAGSPEARTSTYLWHSIWRLPTRITTLNLNTNLNYDGVGRLIRVQQVDRKTSEQRIWTYRYTPQGLLLAVDGPLPGTADTLTNTYNAAGYLASVTNSLGHKTTIVATNGRGLPTNILDPNGVRNLLKYDARGRLTQVTVDADGSPEVWKFNYDASGQIIKITRPDASFLSYVYDGARRLKQVQNRLGEKIVFTYDTMGNIIKQDIQNTAGIIINTQRQTFDELGRLLENVGASGQSWYYGYDKVNNLVDVSDPRGHNFTLAYNGLNQLIEQVDEDDATVTLTKTAEGDVASHTDGRGVQTKYSRNAWGEVVQEISPDAGTTNYKRNELGLAIRKTDARGVVTEYSYDTDGRVRTKTYPASPAENVTYTYDETTLGNKGKGRLTNLKDGSGSTALTYDAKGRVTKEIQTIESVIYTVQYGYGAGGRMASITYPSGRIVRFTRDVDGQMKMVTSQASSTAAAAPVASNIGWRPFGPLAQLTFDNGLVETRTYDADERLTALKVSSGTIAQINKTYLYTDGINLTDIDDLLVIAKTEQFVYTPTNRLADALGSWGRISVDYDETGNRKMTVRTLPKRVSVTSDYTTDLGSNRLVNLTGGSSRSFNYDAAGNMTTDRYSGISKVYGYNAAGRMVSVSVNGSLKGKYRYNAQEQLALRSLATGAIRYIHDLEDHIIAEANAAGTIVREYLWLGDRPLAVYPSLTASPWYVHTDHIDRPIMMTSSSKAIVWQATFEPWGAVYALTGSATLDMRFPGQWFQLESGLHYNWHRHYDPSIGRYLESDPIGLRGGMNTYAYVEGNPITWIDPWGLYHCVGGANCDFTPPTQQALECFDTCTGRDTALTGGRGNRSKPNSSHARGEACDVGRGANPDLTRESAQQCTLQCFPQGYGQEEQNKGAGTHFHIQLNTVPGATPGFSPTVKRYQP